MPACHAGDRGFKSRPDRHYYGSVAQLVEQWTENPCVASSILARTTTYFKSRHDYIMYYFYKSTLQNVLFEYIILLNVVFVTLFLLKKYIIMEVIIMNFKELRENLNLSQEDMAKVLNCGQQKISHIETGRRKLQIEDLAKLIKAFDLTSNYYEDLIIGSVEDKKR